MEDNGSKYTDKEINKLEKKIKKVYSEAQSDIEDKLDDFFQKFDAKNDIYQQKLKDGEITQDQFQQWIKGQVFQSKQWQAKKDQIINTVQNANKEASNMVNGGTIDVFAENANWSHYEMEHTEGVNFGFGIYDSHAVTNLIKNDPQLLPKWKVNEKKDYVWNGKKVDNAITQAIIQGEGLGDIATRIASALESNNRNTMLTFARTAMTGAQNAGRNQGLMDAKDLGIDVVKVWMATLDDHTRVSHREIDGEEQKVGDKWHPYKFSNGCRYPGDPLGPAHEVYNCRCTLVSDIKNYPSKFKRYDNIDGVPVEQMTYKEWKEAKEALSLLPKIDYSQFGGKEAYELIAPYTSYEELLDKLSNEELDKLQDAGIPVWTIESDEDFFKMKDIIDKAHELYLQQQNPTEALKKIQEEKEQKENEQKLKEAEQKLKDAKSQLGDAKQTLTQLQDEVKQKGADKEFKGIWKDTVTYADYESKKDSIPAKEQYYNDQIQKYKDQLIKNKFGGDENLYSVFIEDYDNWNQLRDDIKSGAFDDYLDLKKAEDIWKSVYGALYGTKEHGFNDKEWCHEFKMIDKLQEHMNQLQEFKQHGEEYHKLLEEVKDYEKKVKEYQQNVQDVKVSMKSVLPSSFGGDAYSQARKDAAVWAQSPQEADKYLRDVCGEVWRDATPVEQSAIYEYTQSYHKFNEPLRGYEYGTSKYLGVGNTDLNAGWADNGEFLNAMTSLIDKSSYEEDIWLQRGCEFDGMDKFFQCSMDLLRYGSQEDLENELLGKVVTEYAFMSCGSSKGKGFSSKPITLNVYTPAGTKMMYVEPFSAFGNGSGEYWDGKKTQKSFGIELETILQQGTQFRVTKVEKSRNKLWVDIEVIDQSNQQLWKG